jgi:hypothetical protein
VTTDQLSDEREFEWLGHIPSFAGIMRSRITTAGDSLEITSGPSSAEPTVRTSFRERDGSFVRAYTPAGDEVWTRAIGSTQYPSIDGIAFDGRYVYVAAFSRKPISEGGVGFFVRAFDVRGRVHWTHLLEPNGMSPGDEWALGLSAGPPGVFVNWETGPHAFRGWYAGTWIAHVARVGSVA